MEIDYNRYNKFYNNVEKLTISGKSPVLLFFIYVFSKRKHEKFSLKTGGPPSNLNNIK